jgi:hypothetical protein
VGADTAKRAEHEPVFDALRAAFIEVPPRSGEPSAGLRALIRLVDEGHGQPKGAACRADLVASLDEPQVRPSPCLHAGNIVAHEIRSSRQAVEVLRVKGRLPVGRRKLSAGVRPRLMVKRSPPTHKRTRGGHA